MRAPYGLNILDNCLTCPVREEQLFCNLPVAAVQKLNEIKSTAGSRPGRAAGMLKGRIARPGAILGHGDGILTHHSPPVVRATCS